VLNSGDEVRASLSTIFTPLNATLNATPVFCSGGNDSTLISLGTTVVVGTTPPSLTTLVSTGKPYQTTIFGFGGVSDGFVNTGSTTFTLVVMGVLMTPNGSTVDVLVSSVSITPGGTSIAFLKFNQYPSGTYTIDVLALTGSDVPVSTVQETTVTV
jgi:hypothetical protein